MLKYFTIRAYYVDCPSCAGKGDPELRGYVSFKEFLEEYAVEYDYEYFNLYYVADTLVNIAELWDDKGFHTIKSRNMKFPDRKFEFAKHAMTPEYFNEILEWALTGGQHDKTRSIY